MAQPTNESAENQPLKRVTTPEEVSYLINYREQNIEAAETATSEATQYMASVVAIESAKTSDGNTPPDTESTAITDLGGAAVGQDFEADSRELVNKAFKAA